jgi:serine/threonine-protein kinase
MMLDSGTRFGPYEIMALLGAGGMGEVYRANDMKLGRDVALKILPVSFTNDPERVARFRREAQVLASLNDPHIAQIYGLEEVDGTQFLVLELVDGESLDKRIARGPIPVDEALGIAKQIAEALEAAHEKGIIHRDLKPANIALTTDGNVKVLDFGLAKAVETTSGTVGAMNSPTITSPAMVTGVGVILGTAAYMSPEQAKGRAADKRSDMWAFGCVVYEMLTGRRAFEGEDVSDTLAAVLRSEPDWSALTALPAGIRFLLQGCLSKDRQRRVADISTARFMLSEPSALTPVVRGFSASSATWNRRHTGVAIGAMVLITGAIGAAGAWILKPPPSEMVAHFTIPLPTGQQFLASSGNVLAVSPDGTKLVYAANRGLYLRTLSEAEPRPIAAELGAPGPIYPEFSPDGNAVAFIANAAIRRVNITGGAAVTVCTVTGTPFGLSWSGDEILFSMPTKGVMRVSASGGNPELVFATKSGETAQGARRLPKSGAVLFALSGEIGGPLAQWDKARVVVYLPKSGERRTLIDGGSDGRYLPPGRLTYALGGTLFSVPFDINRMEVTGSPVPILEGVRRATTGATAFGVGSNGLLAYVPGPTSTAGQLDFAYVDSKGGVEPLKLPPRSYTTVRVSPDETRLALGVDDGREAAIWVYELSGTTSMRQLSLGGQNRYPVWSADGVHVAFQSNREGDQAIFRQRADGSGAAERLTKPPAGVAHVPQSWAPDNKRFLFLSRQGLDARLWVYSLDDKKATPFDDVRATAAVAATFSPNGHWVAYNGLADSGVNAVFVQPYPPTGVKYLIGDGIQPVWSRDGKRLHWGAGPGAFGFVTITTTPTLTWGNLVRVPRPFLSSGAQLERPFDIMRDGRVIALVTPSATSSGAANEIRVVLNWSEELKQHVPTK